MQIIDDLRNDLRIRDEEYEEQRKYTDKLLIQNDYLKKELRDAKLDNMTIDSKLAKIVSMRQLEASSLLIERNQFFENRNTKISQLNKNLSNSVKDQHRSCLSISYAAKYARIWLEKTR